ncbi:MAG TPA: pyridoxamine 5'-phosphate oxidase family protein [Flavipsychrobacter sp.]|nr:pyridoxamine 5'-phosphate oxidase family protein [Flavipsychrobacter sp.]
MSTENLSSSEAVKKLKELSEKAGTCMFCTELANQPFETRPMGLQECDEEGNLWFISSNDSNKNFQLKEDNRVQLLFMNNSDYEYLSVYGEAFIYTDRATIEEKWSKMANAWFEEGKDDPKVSIIRVAPGKCYYWDTKAGKLVSLATFVWATVTGQTTDNSDGVEGTLNT